MTIQDRPRVGPRRRQGIDRSLVLRPAVAGEETLVRWLDNEIFPPDDDSLQRAEDGELEDGVAAGDVFLLERSHTVLGYVHMDRTHPECVYISGFGLLPAYQRQGLGTQMFDILFRDNARLRHERPWITVTSPLNHLMLRIVFRRDFAGRWFMPDFFGPGRHRLGCQLKTPRPRLPLAEPEQISVMDFPGLERSIAAGNVIQAYGDAAGDTFLMGPAAADDFLPCKSPFELLHPADR